MSLFGPPDIKALQAKHDLKGLVKALSYHDTSYQYEDVTIRNQAAHAIGSLQDSQVVNLIFYSLTEKHGNYFQEAAFKALGKLNSQSVPLLLDGLTHPEAVIRLAAAEALSEIKDRRAIEPLIAALKDTEKSVVFAVIRSLGEIGDKRAVEPLLDYIDLETYSSRPYVFKSLGQIGDRRAVKPLIRLLEKEPKSSIGIMEALAEIGDPIAADPIFSFICSNDMEVRNAAIFSLARLKDPRVVPYLLNILKDKKMGLAANQAITFLDKIEPLPIEPLIDALKYYEPIVSETAKKLLIKAGAASIEPLLNILHRGTRQNRKSAAAVLIQLYKRKDINPGSKSRILSGRDIITEPHSDSHNDYPSTCETPHDDDHTDHGLGFDFPL
jgi:HEAT repeat protein